MKLPSIPKPKLPKLNAKHAVIFTLILALVLANIWLWLIGPEFEAFEIKPFASLTVRWVLTSLSIVTLLLWGIYALIRRIRRLSASQKQVKEEIKDPVQIEVNRLQRYLSRWVVRLQKHFETKQVTYRLPWYLVIGSRNSGKSTLLKENCKLNSLYIPEKDLPVHCWLGEQMVLVETDGTLLEQPINEQFPALYEKWWQGLLEWLATERTRQPLNGIILTIDLHQLSTFGKVEKERYITTVKERLEDISKHLHNRLPIYIILTKLDLLYGFEAMFQSLDKAQRDEILGLTFPLKDPHWQQTLNHFWHQWMTQLNQALPSMMLHNVDISQRSQLFAFIRQVHGVKEYLLEFIDKTFFSNNNTLFILRGVYLTSSTQKGQMEDLFVKSASSQYNLPEQIYPSWQKPLPHSYFANKLLNAWLFSEPNLAGENSLYQHRNRRQLYKWTAVTAAVLAIMFIGWQKYYGLNYRSGEEVLAKAKEYMEIDMPDYQDTYGHLQLPVLNPIGYSTLAYGDYHSRSPLFADLGLYQGYKIGPHIESTYLRLLQQRFLPAIMLGLQQKLDTAPEGSEEKLKILRIIRMIEDETGRDKNMVMQYMNERWSQKFKGQREIQGELLQHLSYAMDHIKWKNQRVSNDQIAISSYQPFDPSIKDAQVDLRRLSIYQRVYQNLHAQAKSVLPADLNISNQIGASFEQVFYPENSKLLYVPQLLTRSGMINYFIMQDDRLIALTSLDSWVLNITTNVNYSKADQKEIQRQITALYLNDYAATWRSAYNNIHIRKFNSIPEAIAALEQIISGEHVFRRAIQLLKDNTEPKEMDETANGKDLSIGKLLENREYRLLNQLHHEFIKETGVMIDNNGQLSALENTNIKLSELHRYLLAIQNAPSPGKSALQAVQYRLNNKGSDPILEAQQLAKSLPEPLGRWLFEFAEEAWDSIMVEAIKSLEVEWHDRIVTQFNQYFVGRYPFNPASSQDVPLSEFERFFGYGGTLDQFYQQNLKAFIENNLGTKGGGHSLIRPDVIKQLEQAEKIRRTYFSPQQGLGIQFSLQPLEMSGNRRRGILNLDGQLVDYRHASSSAVRLIWPNSMRDNTESKLTLINSANRSNKSLTYTGPWAVIRLINAGKLTNIHNNSFNIRYELDGAHIVYRIHIDEADNPFAGGLFSRFNLPPTLY